MQYLNFYLNGQETEEELDNIGEVVVIAGKLLLLLPVGSCAIGEAVAGVLLLLLYCCCNNSSWDHIRHNSSASGFNAY